MILEAFHKNHIALHIDNPAPRTIYFSYGEPIMVFDEESKTIFISDWKNSSTTHKHVIQSVKKIKELKTGPFKEVTVVHAKIKGYVSKI